MRPEESKLSMWHDKALEGTVVHQRNLIIRHGFTYRIWMALSRLDGSTLPKLLRPRATKYMGMEQILDIAGHGELAGAAQVWLLTQPSLFGRSYNPVSFYFLEVNGELLTTIAHVTNTPWDEDHCYVLEQCNDDTWLFDKELHVSPFMPMHLRYTWRCKITDDVIAIHMQLFDGEERVFAVALNLQPTLDSKWLPVKLRLKYPLQNMLTVVRIYWQAVILKIKGAKFHAHPDPVLHNRLR